MSPDDQSVRDCQIRENGLGVLMDAATNAPFTYKDAYVKLSPVVGHDPDGTHGTTQAVIEFVQVVLKP